MSYLTRYDMVNVKQFEKGRQNGYLCSMCGQYSILDDSVSHQGYNFVCMRCVYKMGDILNDTSIGEIIELVHQKGEKKKKSDDISHQNSSDDIDIRKPTTK